MEKRARVSQFKLSMLAILVGIVAGFGAVAFRALIAFIHNLMFLGKFSFFYDANNHIPASPWGFWVILVPVAGAILVAYLVKNFAPEAKGHGVPEVMDAIYYNKGIIRPIVAVVKSLASAISIGTGGSVGREGPIVQIGSSFGSTLGQFIKMAPWQRATLIGAGAGAGIAATFNTPIGGLLFAIELIVPELSVRTFVPVAIATSTATFIGRIFFGNVPSFIIPGFDVSIEHITNPYLLISYIGLGILSGLISVVFIKSIYAAEDFFDGMKGNYYTRHMLGMLLQGILIYVLLVNAGHYYVAGVGYSTIQDVLMGTLLNPYFLLLLIGLKLLATALTLGSGASGGIFSPSLFIGAALGGMYGSFMKMLFPHMAISPAEFAVVGMAGTIGGITGAAITSIVMIFEMTRNYNVIIPVIITVAIADGIRRVISSDSIYTEKLSRRGHLIPEIFHMNTLLTKKVKNVMENRVIGIQQSMTVEEVLETFSNSGVLSFVVLDGNRIVGVVSIKELFKSIDITLKVSEITTNNYIVIDKEEVIFNVIARMKELKSPMALVCNDAKCDTISEVIGIITKDEIAEAAAEQAELFS